MRRLIISVTFFVVLITTAKSQKSEIYAGFTMPLHYTFGYQQALNGGFSLDTRVGFIKEPFDKLILDAIGMFDVDEVLLNTIGESFDIGINFQPTIKWHFKKSYIGLAYSYLILFASDHPASVIENYYSIFLPLRRKVLFNLQSNLHSGGFVYGRKIQFKNPNLSLNLELSLLKTFSSKTSLKSDSVVEYTSLSNAIDKKLNRYYVSYGALPGINILFAYTFNPVK